MPRKMKRVRDEEPVGQSAKKTKFLDEESDGEDGFTINADFAKRFEHNNKRKEIQQLEEKYGKNNLKFPSRTNGAEEEDDDDSESSSDEDEDDDGEFATADVDAEINDTLNAIRNKDPRVYDSTVKFFKEFQSSAEDGEAQGKSKEKTMTLKDYHRQNLLSATNGSHESEEDEPRTYAQEQAELKNDLVQALHDAADEDEAASSDDDKDGEFLKAKNKSSRQVKLTLPDPSTADKDPENYLSNFFAARAWVPTETSRFAHLESDDESADERAEEFETAYNLRFEDPETSNIKLRTHARDVVAAVSVRRDEALNPRKRARERARLEKEREKEERDEEKARLRKLKLEQMEDKLEKIRYAAGGHDVDIADWAGVLQEDWDDTRFDEEMQKRFGDAYYQGKDQDLTSAAEDEEGSENEDGEKGKKKAKKAQPKKPTWDDDIDIKDLVSDFEDEEEAPALSDDGKVDDDNDSGDDNTPQIPQDSKKHKSKTASKRDRRLLAALADQSTNLELAASSNSKKPTDRSGPRFGYRETSPTTFGLSTLDILAADDAQLNEWAGLKKLATFRDAEKKEKDKRRLGKKGRLREWRKEVFGRKEGPGLEDWYVEGGPISGVAEQQKENGVEDGVDVREGKRKKRKRSKKSKGVEA